MLSILPAELTPEEKNTRNPLRQIPHGEPFPTPEDWQHFFNKEGRQDTQAEAEEADPIQLIGLPEVTYRVGLEGSYNPYNYSTLRSLGSALSYARGLAREYSDRVYIGFVVDGNEVSRVPASNLI